VNFITDGSSGRVAPNSFMKGRETKVNQLINRENDFLTNLNSLSAFINPTHYGTRFDGIAEAFKNWVDSASDAASKEVRREMIQNYPVFLVISDGDMNNSSNATSSMAKFQQDMLQWFGWNGVVVVWNVSTGNMRTDYYKGLTNVIHYFGYNAGIINSIFTKIHDLDIIDVFTPLKSLNELKRYEPVRKHTL